jgi:hypothetical protein
MHAAREPDSGKLAAGSEPLTRFCKKSTLLSLRWPLRRHQVAGTRLGTWIVSRHSHHPTGGTRHATTIARRMLVRVRPI